MNILVDKKLSQSQFSNFDQIVDNEPNYINNKKKKNSTSFFYRVGKWLHIIKRWKQESIPEGQIVLTSNSVNNKNEIMCVNDIPFIIPRQLKDVLEESRSEEFEHAKLIIRRMDEYLLTPEDEDEAKRQRHNDTSLGLRALALATDKIQKVAFREVLSVDETIKDVKRRLSHSASTADRLFRQTEKIDPITDFQEAHDLIEFDEALDQHYKELSKKEPMKPADMLYLKFCVMIEIQRDESESCLRILLHNIIFKFHLADFRIKCEIHLRRPIENVVIIEKVVHDSHLKTNYAAQFILWSGDWIAEQDVDLCIIMKVESLSINKYISSKFWDMAHLYVKNVPHGASRIFLRELTPVSRPYKILSRGINVGQIEIEATYSPTREQLSINILKISHSQAERFLRAPNTYVEVIFQGPFNIYSIQRTKVVDRALNPKFDEEFVFDIPEKTAMSDITVDLIFLEKSSLHQTPTVLGVLILSKHTDWFPVRKFWTQLEENPDITLKNSFLFEGNEGED